MKKNTLVARLARYFLLLVLGVAALTSFHPVYAQQPTPSDDEVNAIARQLFCPVCENTPLDVCPTQACSDWRELIRQMLAEGKTPSEIKQYFVDHYGARVLSEPPQTGLNWLVYIVPPVAFLIGVFLLFKAFRTWKRMSKQPDARTVAGSAPPVGDEYASRLEEELRKRK
jgi:cytochrome c-type biogenesis protein CcmH